jgi:hypothetical protein
MLSTRETFRVIFAYFTPELTFPLASALAAAVGFIMLVGRAPYRLITRTVRSGLSRFKKGTGPGAV